MSSGWHAKYGPWMNELTVACEVGGCQTDAGELVLFGVGCAVVQSSYPLCRIGLLD